MAIEYRKRVDIMARVSKAQTYAVRWLDHENKNTEDIASELNLSVKQVTNILEKYGKSEGSVETKQEPVSGVRSMMNSKTNSNKGVTVMTQEASMAIQESTQKKPPSTDRSSYIYSPNG